MNDKDDEMIKGLDPFFDAARDTAAPVPDALMARILADAAKVADQTVPAPNPLPPQRAGLLQTLLAALGGWPAAAGLATVTGLGVMVGYSPPDLLSMAFESTALSDGIEDSTGWMLADYDAFLEDG